MSPPRHISYSLLLPTTGLQVNTSSKPPESYQYHRSPCQHLALYHILYYYLTQVYRSTRRQNPENHTSIFRSPCPHLAIYLIFYCYLLQVYRSTRRQNPQNHTSNTGQQVRTSPHLLSSTTTYYLLQVYRSACRQNPQNHTSTIGQDVRHIYRILH